MSKHTQRHRRGDARRGATIIEFAIVVPLLLALLNGIVTVGIAFNRRLAVTNGVREGSRYGATLSVAAAGASSSCSTTTIMDCWLTQVANIVQQASEGQLGASTTGREICVAYVYPNGTQATDSTRRLVRTGSGDVISSGTCFTDGRPASERRVQVRGARPAELQWVFASTHITLTGEAVTRFEATT